VSEGGDTFSINLYKYALNHLIKMLHVMFNHLERDDDNNSY
jgi:hypothetical protein